MPWDVAIRILEVVIWPLCAGAIAVFGLILFRSTSVTMDEYPGYLKSHQLVSKDNESISITKTGEDFLRWLLEQRGTSSRRL